MTNHKQVVNKLTRLKNDSGLEECLFLGTLLAKHDISREEWIDCKADPALHPRDLKRMLLLEQAFEAKVLESAITGKCTASVALFALKSVYGYTDKAEKTAPEAPNGPTEIPYMQLNDERILL